ncbi:MAG: acyltransferase [bacterium]|nr:acyltransferase [bacterium]
MKHKIEIIDYLRGLAILFMTLQHVILPFMIMHPNRFSSDAYLLVIRDVLNFSVGIIIICSGFSLYYSCRKLQFKNIKDILLFYKKRILRLLVPWFVFVMVSLVSYGLLLFFSKENLEKILAEYSFIQSVSLFGIPIGFAFHWIVIAMVLLTFLFPFLKYIYEKSKYTPHIMVLVYLIAYSVSLKFPLEFIAFPQLNVNVLSIASFIVAFLAGWGLVYMFGFSLEKLYEERKLRRHEWSITLFFIALFIIDYFVLKRLGIETMLNLSKFPPSPHFLLLGIVSTLLVLNILDKYYHTIHAYFRKILSFLSYNSYWLYLYGFWALAIISYLFGYISEMNVYLRLFLEFTATMLLASFIVVVQQKIVKLKVMIEKHHF